jgi:hypothetical protein
MKFVEFYSGTSGKPVKVGEVRLVDGALEFSDEWLKHFLEETAVLYGGKVYWPWDDDKEKYLSLLPYGFHGSMFWAEKVLER